ncbi:phosphoribosylglycinamide formyltransferase [Agaribacterium haliotis]|uniref:phosphoribosylglycinamide formyltransferase n=1 Tax=Agaribacterium haliotis TaxID=2013869 RepID=UPI000BB58AAF|nr:phosphoribosylglycinamide formyltransferase [Agaribacterium haliotis]
MSSFLTRVVVMISGSGSNLQALIDAQESSELPIKIVAVISNKDNVKGLERAATHNIPAFVVSHKAFASREDFDARIMEIIDAQGPDLVVLAGFMRILTEDFTRHYEGRMLNIHPSLLPKYQGLHTHQRALDAGDSEHGASVHFVTAELDGGPLVIQAKVDVEANDDATSLAAKVLKQEHLIYPLAVKWFAEGRLQYQHKQCLFDGEALPEGGLCYSTKLHH